MSNLKIIMLIIIVLFPSLNLEGLEYEAMPSVNVEYTRQDFQGDMITILNGVLPLEEDEVVLDYRYIAGEDLEVFSQIGETYYRKFYNIIDHKMEKISEEVIELGKGGLKIKE